MAFFLFSLPNYSSMVLMFHQRIQVIYNILTLKIYIRLVTGHLIVRLTTKLGMILIKGRIKRKQSNIDTNKRENTKKTIKYKHINGKIKTSIAKIIKSI